MIDEQQLRKYIERGARIEFTMKDGTFVIGDPKRIICMTFVDMGDGVRVNEELIEAMGEA